MGAASTAPLGALALVLAWAGAAKLLRPGPAVEALRAGGLPTGAALVRSGALIELALAIWVLAAGAGPAAWALAVAYLAFALVSLRLMSRAANCGCFGAADGPLTRWHVVMCLACAALAGGSALAGAPAPLSWSQTLSAGSAGALAVATAAGAGALILCFTDLPGVWTAWTASGEG